MASTYEFFFLGFLRPEKAAKESDDVWYDNMLVGQRIVDDEVIHGSEAPLHVYMSLD